MHLRHLAPVVFAQLGWNMETKQNKQAKKKKKKKEIEWKKEELAN